MIADISVNEKSFGPKTLMTGVTFTINGGEKIGLIGRNGIGKSTLFGILAGQDKDFSGDIIYRRGTVVVATRQEHHGLGDQTVLSYILSGLPEYPHLSHIIERYPLTMGSDMKKIREYSEALERFSARGFYVVEEAIERELENFQLKGAAHRLLDSLSGGEKRLVEVVKVMHSDADLALIDEPTNHMDYVAKAQFIDWLKQAPEAMLVITHDRDVLHEVDRIIELKDGLSLSFKGNYQAYLRQNTTHTSSQMNEFEVTQRQIDNLKKRVQYARSKKAAWGGTADKKNPFVVMEERAQKEIKELSAVTKPSFWIDKTSVEAMDYKAKRRYDKYKTRNIRLDVRSDESRSKHILAWAKDLSLGYGGSPLFSGINIDLREGEALELRGRNGAGKTTLIRALLSRKTIVSGGRIPTLKQAGSRHDESNDPSLYSAELARAQTSSNSQEASFDSSGRTDNAFSVDILPPSSALQTIRPNDGFIEPGYDKPDQQRVTPSGAAPENVFTPSKKFSGADAAAGPASAKAYVPDGEQEAVSIVQFAGELGLDKHARIGVYEQEVSPGYFDLPLEDAIERLYLDRGLAITITKIRSLMSDYLFTETDRKIPVRQLSGGQKARFQLISMLANDPQLLILDEPTNHLDLPSIEELESALKKYSGAILYVSHDGYFSKAIGGEVVEIGA